VKCWAANHRAGREEVAMALRDRSLVGIDDVLGKGGGNECVAMTIPKTIKGRHSLCGDRPIEAPVFDHEFGGNDIAS
jgi:hypothetical protein